MYRYVSILRGINVGGNKKITMDDLKKLYKSLGFTDVVTYIQSGNLIFRSTEIDKEKLRDWIAEAIQKTYNFKVNVQILIPKDLDRIIKNNPFKLNDLSKLHVTFLAETPKEIPYQEIDKMRDKSEKISIVDREIYLYCPNGYSKTKLTNNFLEKKLKVSATTRNWRTVNKIFELST